VAAQKDITGVVWFVQECTTVETTQCSTTYQQLCTTLYEKSCGDYHHCKDVPRYVTK
jgi:hypothetical protein